MADGNSYKLDDDLNIADTDPMAELTRIMSFGAPAAREVLAADPEDGFTLDLEHELLGDDFALEAPREPLALPPAQNDVAGLPAPSGFSIERSVPASPSGTALLDDLDLDLDEALGSAFADEAPDATLGLAEDDFTAGQLQDEADTAEDLFANAFQNADFDHGINFDADEPASGASAYQLSEPKAAADAEDLPASFSDPFAGQEGEALFADAGELNASDAEEAGWQAFHAHEQEIAAAKPHDDWAGEPDPVLAAMEEITRSSAFAPQETAAFDLQDQPADFAEGLSMDVSAEETAEFAEARSAFDAAFVHAEESAAAPAAAYRFHDDGIEDELAAMLEGRAAEPAMPGAEPAVLPEGAHGVTAIAQQTEADIADFDLGDFDENAFLDQEFAGDDLGLGEEVVEELSRLEPTEQPKVRVDEAALEFDPELLAGIEAAADDWNAPASQEPLFADDAAWQELDEAAPVAVESPVPSYRQDAAAVALEEPEHSGMIASGAAAMAAAGTVAAVKAGGLTSGFLSRFSRPDAKARAADVPEIETSEIVETAVEPAGDLDLPDLGMVEDEAAHASTPAYDDLYGQGYRSQATAAPQTEARLGDPLTTEFDTLFADEMAGSGYKSEETNTLAGGEHYQSPADQEARYDNASMAMDETGLDGGYDRDLDRNLAAGFEEDHPATERPRNKRGLFVAAVVAGVALLGGIGAFALNFNGGDTAEDGTAVVRADKTPVKVKPAEKEIAEAPTAGKVYDQVAGKPVAEKPSQTSLVTTEAKPIDVNSQGARVITPGPTDDASGVKSEERIDPASAAEPEQAPEIAAVRPKRVKTFVVRPDGTLVAAEEPAAPAAPVEAPKPAASVAKAAEPAPQPIAAKETVVASANPEPEPAALKPVETPKPAAKAAPADKIEAKPVRTTSVKPPKAPDAVPVVPSRPSDQPVNIVGTTRAAEATPTATPVSAPAAGEVASSPAWVQISSHPTRELAQASYRNAQARFGSIINGKGVNIAAAEIPGRGTFHRVNIPAASFNEATALCKRIKAAGGDCLAKR